MTYLEHKGIYLCTIEDIENELDAKRSFGTSRIFSSIISNILDNYHDYEEFEEFEEELINQINIFLESEGMGIYVKHLIQHIPSNIDEFNDMTFLMDN